MVLGVSGLGNTGSFALIDFLREYDEVFFDEYMGECSLCYCPDGLLDLEYHILKAPFRFQSSDAALWRFEKLVNDLFANHSGERHKYNQKLLEESKNYINQITQVSWEGTWGFRINNRSSIKRFVQKVLFKTKPIFGEKAYVDFTNETMRYSVRPDNFLDITKQYIKKMIDATAVEEKKYTLIDQLFPGDNPEQAFHFFDNPVAIVVDRDPRDLYILSKSEIRADSTWIPTDTVEQFILYYKLMREKSDPILNNDKVLRFQYERLIYEYDNVEREIEEFLGIKNHVRKHEFFKPEVSINNTQLFNKHPEYSADVKKIEKELSEWIFDYSKFEKRTVFGKTF